MSVSSLITSLVVTGLWEGALIAGIVWIALRMLPKLSAATRYAMWLTALLAIALIPFGALRESAQTTGSVSAIAVPEHASPSRAVLAAAGSTEDFEPAVPTRPSPISISEAVARAVALVWILAAAARGIRLTIDMFQLIALRRTARPWSLAHGYPVFVSDHAAVPMAFGLREPAILVPTRLAETLPAAELDSILQHEAAHLRRADVWTNGIARFIEVFLALNPAAWFVVRELGRQREIACDDWVVERYGTGADFAQTLAALACGSTFRSPISAPGALNSRHAIVERIERLLDPRPRRLRFSASAVAATLATILLSALVVESVSPVLAFETSGSIVAATSCADPNRTISFRYLVGPKHGHFTRLTALPSAHKVIAAIGKENAVIFDLTVDEHGKTRDVALVSTPRYPGMEALLRNQMQAFTFEPALHNCKPIVATLRTAYRYRPPVPWTVSVVTPIYPNGWHDRNPNSCKIGTVTHANYPVAFLQSKPFIAGLPTYPDSMKSVARDAVFTTTTRVNVNEQGKASNVAVVQSSGKQGFDMEAVAAAKRSTLPLAPTSCRPLPREYVWYTTYRWYVGM